MKRPVNLRGVIWGKEEWRATFLSWPRPTRRTWECFQTGDTEIPFTIQSIGKTFSLILALETGGFEETFSKVGMEPSGDSFDSIIQLEMKNWTPYNPLINCGAIATVSCIRSKTPFEDYLDLVRRLCGDPKARLSDRKRV